VDYNNKHKSLVNTSFSFIYYTLYINFFILTKINFIFEKTKSIINKTQTLNQSQRLLMISLLNNFLNSNSVDFVKKFQELNIDEI
jgi:hypothetical protein